MAEIVKKVIIKKDLLPPVGLGNEYYFRYRLISDDKNRISHWSPTYILNALDLEQVSGSVSLSGDIVLCVWGDELLRPRYDVFVKNDTDEYFYHGTTATHSYSFINEATTSVRVAIQVEAREKTRSESLTIYESDPFMI
jgi:hypothetical protein